jgi:hypothetical protein
LPATIAGPLTRVVIPATQDTINNVINDYSAKIKKATDQFIKHLYFKKRKEEEILWKIIAEELRRRLLFVGETQANE